MNLRTIIEENDTKSGKVFNLFIQFLILVSLVSFSIETLPNLDNQTKYILNILEIVIVVIFTIEYLLRLFFSDHKIKYIFSFFGIIDLIAILPFYIASGMDLRSIRVFRLFRIFRIVKVLKYGKAIKRISLAFSSVKEELILFMMATGILLYISAVGIYYFENPAQPEQFKSVFHCMWWAIATLTTVGYGDVYPITAGGKIFTSVVVIIGIGIVAVPSGLLASAMTKIIKDEEEEQNN
jgi:voltage-gated potassium channel